MGEDGMKPHWLGLLIAFAIIGWIVYKIAKDWFK